VKLGLKTAKEVETAYDDILKSVAARYPRAVVQGVSVQKMARPGVEVIIGVSHDIQFGPVIMFGLGGILVEIFKDVAFRVIPLTRRDASEMVREIKGYSLLQGFRGQEPVDIATLEDWLVNLSDFAERNPAIEEIDLNPIFAYSRGALAVDARVVLAPSEKSRDKP
jgi:acyl-CoA synthetase (NDP forming)